MASGENPERGGSRLPQNVGQLLQLCIENQSSNNQEPVEAMSQEVGVFSHSWFNWHEHVSPPLLRMRRGSGLDCGSDNPGLIPGITSPHMGPLMARRLKTSSDVPVPVYTCRGRLGMLKTPSCPWRWVPGGRSKFGKLTTVPSLYSWNITECDVKQQPTNKHEHM